ncbi:MAG: hypothetical protein D6722_13535 [Bacteroidetes bacterium]|nr:MAG: hypothetical protein D6722_13535 [Bacteroidota bacterium]
MHLLRFFTLLGALGLALPASAQLGGRPYFPFFQQEFFFGNLPSPRAEAMARAGVALPGAPTSYYYNPAGIGTVEDWAAEATTSAPFYLLREADYYHAGFVKRFHPKLVAGLNLYQFAMGPSTFTVDIEGEDFELEAPTSTDMAATVAFEPLSGLQLGLTAHLFNWDLFDDVADARSLYLDFGALYTRQLASGDRLTAGLGVVNITGDEITFESPIGTTSSNVFPIVARLGLTYEKELRLSLPGAGDQPLALLVTTEYQDLLNNDFRTTFRLGTEAVLADVLAVRLGFFTQNQDDQGVANNRDRVSDITYGFGFILPLKRLSEGRIPARLALDFYAMEPPPVVFQGTRLPNRRGFGLRLISDLSTQ